MNQLILLFALILLLQISCNNPKPETYNKSNKEVTNKIEDSTNILIQGSWGSDENDNANFGIYKDSIYYPDPDTWLKISILNDTLFIHEDESNVEKALIMKLDEDSLLLNYLTINVVVGYARRN